MNKISSLTLGLLSISALAHAGIGPVCTSGDKNVSLETTREASSNREGDTVLVKLSRPGKVDAYLSVHPLTLQRNAYILNGIGYGIGRGNFKLSLGKINSNHLYPKAKLSYQHEKVAILDGSSPEPELEKFDLSCSMGPEINFENICSTISDQDQLDRLLLKASAQGDIDLAEQMLACGANAKTQNSMGCSPLMLAVSAEGLDCQDPHDIPSLIDPLRWNKGRYIFKMLLEEGAMSASVDEKGQTIVHKVIAQGFDDLISILKEYNAKINIQDTEGLSPLMLAAKNGYAQGVKALVEAGADKSLKNLEGKTAYDLGENLLPQARKLLLNVDSDGIVIQGASTGCSPLRINIPMGVSTKITLKAGPSSTITMVQSKLGINLKATAGTSASQTIRFDGMGTYKFQCGVDGGTQVTGQITFTM